MRYKIVIFQVFVYLFAPLGDFLKHSDFMTSFRLENGLKLWESLWEYKHPNVPCFTTHVMPKRAFLKGKRDKQNAAKFGDVFIGAGWYISCLPYQKYTAVLRKNVITPHFPLWRKSGFT